mmetsp:Transcript_18236/g.25693  ORF Transcript_18236/g.25693 Transcript_18236/m.25693 type:complete len:84 (+) Transcript_18236:103-354(+)
MILKMASSRQSDSLNSAISSCRYDSLERAILLNAQKASQEQHQVRSMTKSEDTQATPIYGQQEQQELRRILEEVFDIVQERLS